jgi:flagellar hook-associated protein 1 FlgK
MTGLFGVLNIGYNGLQAANFGTSVTSNNASNVATDGYTRCVAEIKPMTSGVVGGARAGKSVRVADIFIDQRLVSAQTVQGEAAARADTLKVLDTVFSNDAGTVSNALDKFEAAVSDLASMPDDTTARTAFLQRADQLASTFQQASAALTSARADANQGIIESVGQVNTRLEQISTLNSRIIQEEIAGRDGNNLIDERDQLVREVASYLPVTVIREPNEAVTLMLGGSRTLVNAQGGEVSLLAGKIDATSGNAYVYRKTGGATEDVTSLFTSGKIGGYINGRDGALQQARDGLDQLARDMVTAYNNVHVTGYGLDSTRGRNLFEPIAADEGAAHFQLSAGMVGHPEYVAAATDLTALPGDNRGALALQALQDDKVASLNGVAATATVTEALQALVVNGGGVLQLAQNDQQSAQTALDQIRSLRESVSGVSSDEEMIALARYQRAYQASLRVVEIANAMLNDLMSMTSL